MCWECHSSVMIRSNRQLSALFSGAFMSYRILLVRVGEVWGRETEEVLRSSVERDGACKVVHATSGEEAVSIASVDPVDLVIAEMVLSRPGISGAYTLIRVRELCPDCRSILVSDHDYVASLLTQVADVFLVRSPKPSTSALGLRLTSITNDLLSGRRPRATNPEVAPTNSQLSTIVEAGKPTESSPKHLVAGKYRLGAKLGQGGMGMVFQAEDIFIQRPVAIKLLRVQSSSRKAEELQRRMHREVMIAGRLTHPHIVTVHDAGFDGVDIYLVMALVEGRTLRHHIANRGSLPVEESIEVALQILEALAYAHSKGVVHRDLKPSNVLMTRDGNAKVADFGLAKIRSLAAEGADDPPSAVLKDLTAEGVVLGTFGYMAPEQMLSWESDPRSDLYSLGAIFFEMVHGRPLAQAVSPIRMARYLQLGQTIPSIPELSDQSKISQLLERAIALRPDDRYQDSKSFADDLRALVS